MERFSKKVFKVFSLFIGMTVLFVPGCKSSQHSDLNVINGSRVDGYSEVVKISANWKQCTGTCIRSDVILTAQHCKFDRSRVVTLQSSDKKSTRLRVKKVVNKPGYRRGAANDLALLFLEGDFCTTVSTICSDPLSAGQEIKIVGYGTYEEELSGPSGLLHQGTNRLDVAGPSVVQYSTSLLTSDERGDRGDSFSGVGDSGGPIFIENATRCIAGITSRSRGKTQYDVNMVSNRQWVAEQLSSIEQATAFDETSDTPSSTCTERDIRWCTGIFRWDPNCAKKCPHLRADRSETNDLSSATQGPTNDCKCTRKRSWPFRVTCEDGYKERQCGGKVPWAK